MDNDSFMTLVRVTLWSCAYLLGGGLFAISLKLSGAVEPWGAFQWHVTGLLTAISILILSDGGSE